MSDPNADDKKLAIATTRIHRLTMAGLTLEMIGADFIRRRIAPLHNKGRPAWLFRNAADIMRLRPGLKHNFTVMGHAHFCQRLFQLNVGVDGRAERVGKTVKAGKGHLFRLPAGVVPLSKNSRQTDIIAMMPDFNAHDLDPNCAEPEAEQVQEFFDNLSERYVRDEPLLIQDTTKEALDYITARAAKAALAREAGSTGHVEDEAKAAVEEKELARWVESAGEASSTGTGSPLIEDVVEESTEEEAEADDPPATGKRHVPLRASSGEPVRPGRTKQRQEVEGESVRLTRAMEAKKVVKAAVAKKRATASSSSKCCRTTSPSPPPADVDTEVVFDLWGSLSPRRKRKATEEEVEDE